MSGAWFRIACSRAIVFPIERLRGNMMLHCMVLATIVTALQMNPVHAKPLPTTYVTYSFDVNKQILTLTGDDFDNSISVTWSGSAITITAFGQTRIGDSTSSVTSVTLTQHVNSSFTVNGNLNGGNDYVALVTLPSPSVTLNMGIGNDSVKFTYCGIGNLTLDGGTGTNSLAEVATRITASTITNIQVILPPH